METVDTAMSLARTLAIMILATMCVWVGFREHEYQRATFYGVIVAGLQLEQFFNKWRRANGND